MTTRLFPLALFGFVLGCVESTKEEVDSDGDGLTDTQEEEFGSDPNSADSDEDGVDDATEYEMGLDPNSVDSDGDGYEDSWEIAEGSDPADESSLIYKGGWPYQPDKDSYNAPTSTAETDSSLGSALPRFELMDQFGEQVDIYDFAGQGKYIVVDVSAMWCPPCQSMASWLAGNDYDGWGSYVPNVADKVHNGEIYWITVLGENNNGRVPTEENLYSWYTDYPDDNIPVFADTSNKDIAGLYVEVGWPTILVFDQDLKLVAKPTSNNTWAGLEYANDL